MIFVSYQTRRRNILDRLRRLRELNAPDVIVRGEQLHLWTIRQHQMQRSGWNMRAVDLPGWQENYEKFVRIHGNPKGWGKA